jgi:hypothetical protein
MVEWALTPPHTEEGWWGLAVGGRGGEELTLGSAVALGGHESSQRRVHRSMRIRPGPQKAVDVGPRRVMHRSSAYDVLSMHVGRSAHSSCCDVLGFGA